MLLEAVIGIAEAREAAENISCSICSQMNKIFLPPKGRK
jgi:hypothetical protein